MAKRKFYGVRVGKQTGVFETWEECKAQVEGIPGSSYQSFSSLEEAEQFVNGNSLGDFNMSSDLSNPFEDQIIILKMPLTA